MRFSRMEGGATFAGWAAPAWVPGLEPVEETSGFNLMVFLAAEEADAAFADTGILFKAAVSVLRIFSALSSPDDCIFLSVSAMCIILSRTNAWVSVITRTNIA